MILVRDMARTRRLLHNLEKGCMDLNADKEIRMGKKVAVIGEMSRMVDHLLS